MSVLGGQILRTVGGIPDDYIGYWPFNGNANDESGNGHDGTVSGATLVNDRNGNPNSAYYFDASSVITIPTFSRGSNGISISTWLKQDGHGLTSRAISHIATTGRNFELVNNSKTPIEYFSVFKTGDIAVNISSTDDLGSNWAHLVVTTRGLNGDNVYLYIDNVLKDVALLDADLVNENRLMTFGRSARGALQWWRGTLDDTRYYNRELTLPEIEALYNE